MIATIVKTAVDVGGTLGVLHAGDEVEVTRPDSNPGFYQLHRDGKSSDQVSPLLFGAWCVCRRAADLGYPGGDAV